MTTRPRIAINGLGRIGRLFARIAATDPNCPFDLVAANDLAQPEALAYLMKFDTTHRKLDAEVKLDGDKLHIGRHEIKLFSQTDPNLLPWKDLNVDVVIESTGKFVKRAAAAAHLNAGAKRVVISAPGDGKDKPDATVVAGINDDTLEAGHQVISAASCTTTCLAPVAKTLHESFGIKVGMMTTVHAYTGDQAVLDIVHKKDFRRGRSSAQNIVPTSTGAAKAIGLVVPALDGKLYGVALRVPVQDVSLVDLMVEVEKPTTIAEVNEALRAAEKNLPAGAIRVEDQPVVSSDMIGDPVGAIVDSQLTHVQGGNHVKVVAWYDNEWGYSSRLYVLTCSIVKRFA